MKTQSFEGIGFLSPYLATADHVDVKTVEGNVSLRTFVAEVFSYSPAWMEWLWRIRVQVVRMLGITVPAEENLPPLAAQTLPVSPGEKAAFLTVGESDGSSYWAAESCENHLDFAVAVVVEPQSGQGGQKRFHVLTAVRYNTTAGRLYFNLIRPFHHLVVQSASRHAVRTA